MKKYPRLPTPPEARLPRAAQATSQAIASIGKRPGQEQTVRIQPTVFEHTGRRLDSAFRRAPDERGLVSCVLRLEQELPLQRAWGLGGVGGMGRCFRTEARANADSWKRRAGSVSSRSPKEKANAGIFAAPRVDTRGALDARQRANTHTRRSADFSRRRAARPSATGSFRSRAGISADSCNRRAASSSWRGRNNEQTFFSGFPGSSRTEVGGSP